MEERALAMNSKVYQLLEETTLETMSVFTPEATRDNGVHHSPGIYSERKWLLPESELHLRMNSYHESMYR